MLALIHNKQGLQHSETRTSDCLTTNQILRNNAFEFQTYLEL